MITTEIQGLLIDIDDTLIRFKPGLRPKGTGSLMSVLQRAGCELGGLPDAETTRRMEHVRQSLRWWSWTDFIHELGLDPDEFWEYAYAVESTYLEPEDPALATTLASFRKDGLRLFITSNNPNAGIRHKLRLAGLSPAEIDVLFDALFGATELTNMKWEREYWLKVIRLSGLAPENLCVVGDNIRDDYEVPRTAGLSASFVLDRTGVYNTLAARPGLVLIKRLADLASHRPTYVSNRTQKSGIARTATLITTEDPQ